MKDITLKNASIAELIRELSIREANDTHWIDICDAFDRGDLDSPYIFSDGSMISKKSDKLKIIK